MYSKRLNRKKNCSLPTIESQLLLSPGHVMRNNCRYGLPWHVLWSKKKEAKISVWKKNNIIFVENFPTSDTDEKFNMKNTLWIEFYRKSFVTGQYSGAAVRLFRIFEHPFLGTLVERAVILVFNLFIFENFLDLILYRVVYWAYDRFSRFLIYVKPRQIFIVKL